MNGGKRGRGDASDLLPTLAPCMLVPLNRRNLGAREKKKVIPRLPTSRIWISNGDDDSSLDFLSETPPREEDWFVSWKKPTLLIVRTFVWFPFFFLNIDKPDWQPEIWKLTYVFGPVY